MSASTADPKKPKRKLSLIEYHFNIDKDTFAFLGVLHQDENLSRDVHDWFNIIYLIPLCYVNYLNWSFGEGKLMGTLKGTHTVPELWNGEYFMPFFVVVAAYFVIDLLWVTFIPNCVKSPFVLQLHHATTLGYIMIPYFFPEYGWLMGANLSVEVNTWFLIARRVFNKRGEVAFTFNSSFTGPVHVKIISIFFYFTWILVRIVIYPILFFVMCNQYSARWTKVGSAINVMTVAPVFQLMFCYMNLKWSFDLFMSKLKSKGGGPSKGL